MGFQPLNALWSYCTIHRRRFIAVSILLVSYGALGSAQSTVQSRRLQVYAGVGPPFDAPLSGLPATAQGLNGLRTVFSDGAGGFYFTSASSSAQEVHAVYRVDASGILCLVPGTNGLGNPASRLSPTGLALDKAGNLYIAETGTHRVRKVDPNGIISTIAGTGVAGFRGDGGPAASAAISAPRGVATDARGNVYIADTGNHRVRRVTPQGIISTVVGTGKPGLNGDGGPAVASWLTSPQGLAMDSEGNLFIADHDNHSIRMVTSKGVIWTVAGSGTPGLSGDGGPALSAELRGPSSVAVGADGALFIADAGNRRIRRVFNGRQSGRAIRWSSFSPKNAEELHISTVAEAGPDDLITSGYSAAPGVSPKAAIMSVAVESGGNLLVSTEDRVYLLSPKGVITTVAGNRLASATLSKGSGPAIAARLNLPMGVASDGKGNLLIVDVLDRKDLVSRILKVTPQGTISDLDMQGRGALHVDAGGNFYFAEEGRIRKVLPDGQYLVIAGTTAGFGGDGGPASSAQLKSIRGFIVGRDGSVYIADAGNQRIRKIDPNGIISTIAGNGKGGFSGDGGPATSAELYDPAGVALDASGNLFIADERNRRIRKVNPQGTISTFAGTSAKEIKEVRDPLKDGVPAAEAPLGVPSALVVDSGANVFVADRGARRIFKITARGIISTIAGPYSPTGFGDLGINTELTPSGIALDAAGNLFVADSSMKRVYKIPSP